MGKTTADAHAKLIHIYLDLELSFFCSIQNLDFTPFVFKTRIAIFDISTFFVNQWDASLLISTSQETDHTSTELATTSTFKLTLTPTPRLPKTSAMKRKIVGSPLTQARKNKTAPGKSAPYRTASKNRTTNSSSGRNNTTLLPTRTPSSSNSPKKPRKTPLPLLRSCKCRRAKSNCYPSCQKAKY